MLLLAATACGAAPATAPTAAPVMLGSIGLSLLASNGRCAVRSGGVVRALTLPWPCQFHRLPSGAVRIREEGAFRYVLIEAVEPRAEPKADCITRLQALRT